MSNNMSSNEAWRQNLITIEFSAKVTETVTIQNAQVLTYTFTARSGAIAGSGTLHRTRSKVTTVVDSSKYTLDLAGGTLTLTADVVAAGDSFELSYHTPNPLRLWTGYGPLTFGNQTYQGAGAVLGVSEVETALGEPDKRVTLHLSGIPRPLRRTFLQDAGPKEVLIEWIFSLDRGKTWSKAPNTTPFAFRGRLSTPSMTQGMLTVEVETMRGDVDRGRPLRWSHEDQQQRHPGDLGMTYMRALANEGVTTAWPP